MKIDLGTLAGRSRTFETAFEPAELDLPAEDIVPVGLVEASGEVVPIDGGYKVTGRVRLSGVRSCIRCLADTSGEFDFSFEATFVTAPGDDGSEAEVAIDELDASVHQDNLLDLAEVIREQILLALPDRPLCGTDCRGLCPTCGADKNLIDCTCGEDEIDPRWAALKGLK